ncbi:MAG TPA: hypothetical protein VFW00_12915 [Rhodocyclaceae bacterium]|nr:hypothetical protein [Rhodocyclaceae bacterium]
MPPQSTVVLVITAPAVHEPLPPLLEDEELDDELDDELEDELDELEEDELELELLELDDDELELLDELPEPAAGL